MQYSNFSKPGGDAIDCNQYASPDIHSYNDIKNSLIGINVDATSYPDVGTTYYYGRNDITNNDYAISSSNVNTIYAENNWFGSAPPDDELFEGTIDYTPYLSSDPTSTTYPKMNSQQRIVPLSFAEEKIYSTDKRGQEEFKQAHDAYAQKNLTTAQPLFEAVYQQYPDSPIGKQALAFAAKCAYQQEDKSNVKGLLDQVSNQYKNSDIAILAKSLKTAYMLRAQQYDDAISAAEEIVKNHKTSSYYKYALYNLGNVYWMHLKDKSTGEKYYRQLIDEFPKDELSYSALTTIGEWSPEMEKQFTEEVEATSTVFQNHPNPFNPVTTISFKAAKDAHFTLKVYNIRGQEVAVLLDGHRQAGTHQVLFDASNLPSGTYFYRLEGGGMNVVKKMILLK